MGNGKYFFCEHRISPRFCIIFLAPLLFVTAILGSACEHKEESKDSILVIAVERLRQSDIRCAQSVSGQIQMGESSGFQILCNEAERYPHHWLGNTHSLPNLALLLAGPSSVQSNRQHLDQSSLTLAELAEQRGFRTAFWSSGPPFLRASGITQGFETIDDSWSPPSYRLARPLSAVRNGILNWISTSSPFFAVITASDLNEPWINTRDEFGVERAKSVEGHIEDLDFRLGEIFSELKKMRRWENTLVIVLGLSGRSEGDRAYPESLDLHSEHMQSSLFIKPAKKRQVQTEQSVHISTNDVHDIIKSRLLGAANPRVPTDSKPILQIGSYVNPEGQQFDIQGIRLRNFLVLNVSPGPKIYNSLLDSFERTPWTDGSDELRSVAADLRDRFGPGLKIGNLKSSNLADLWEPGLTRAKLKSILDSNQSSTLSHLAFHIADEKEPAQFQLPMDECETSFLSALGSKDWKLCRDDLLQLFKKWSQSPDDLELTIQLSRGISTGYLQVAAQRVDLNLGRPWQVPTDHIRSLWVMDKIVRGPSPSDADPSWREKYIELRRAVRRKPVL